MKMITIFHSNHQPLALKTLQVSAKTCFKTLDQFMTSVIWIMITTARTTHYSKTNPRSAMLLSCCCLRSRIDSFIKAMIICMYMLIKFTPYHIITNRYTVSLYLIIIIIIIIHLFYLLFCFLICWLSFRLWRSSCFLHFLRLNRKY